MLSGFAVKSSAQVRTAMPQEYHDVGRAAGRARLVGPENYCDKVDCLGGGHDDPEATSNA
jgi:hypothetical protein